MIRSLFMDESDALSNSNLESYFTFTSDAIKNETESNIIDILNY